MGKSRRLGPSPAMVVAVVALVAAITGTAVAGPDASTSVNRKKTKQIAKKQAKKQINKQTPWQSGDIAAGAIGTSQLSDEAVKADELGEINQNTTTVTIQPDQQGEATAQCDNDEKVISGGFDGVVDPQFNGPGILTHVDKRANNGWTARAVNLGNAPGQLVVYAYCLEPSE